MADDTRTIIEAQPDWLTVSAHGTDAATNLHLWALLRVHEQRALGNRLQRFRLEGYEGQHCGAVEWGRRDESAVLVRLIGQLADTHLTEALSLADTCTRLDLAVTVRHTPPDPHVGANVYTLAEQHRAANPRSALPWQVRDADGGVTTYVGARGSANMLRVYNKEAECRATGDAPGVDRYRGCWRYELEAKGPMSMPLAQAVNARTDRGAYVAAYVHAWMLAHGVLPQWDAQTPVRLIPGFRRRSDADSKLRHLARNVKPTVEWLVAEGYEDEMRRALGLE